MIIEQEATVNSDLVTGEVKALVKRGITEQTCAKWGYKVGTYQGKSAHIAPYYKQGKVVPRTLSCSVSPCGGTVARWWWSPRVR